MHEIACYKNLTIYYNFALKQFTVFDVVTSFQIKALVSTLNIIIYVLHNILSSHLQRVTWNNSSADECILDVWGRLHSVVWVCVLCLCVCVSERVCLNRQATGSLRSRSSDHLHLLLFCTCLAFQIMHTATHFLRSQTHLCIGLEQNDKKHFQ